MSESAKHGLIREFSARGWNTIIGPCMPECVRRTGGVAIMAKKLIIIDRVRARTKDLQMARTTGRLDAYWMQIMQTQILVLNVYGYTAGNDKEERAEKTDDILCIAIQEMEAWRSPPTMLAAAPCALGTSAMSARPAPAMLPLPPLLAWLPLSQRSPQPSLLPPLPSHFPSLTAPPLPLSPMPSRPPPQHA